MVSTVSCQHCGDEHPSGLARCPRSTELMFDPGPCGTKIDRYLVKKLIGTGGFGSVYLAVHTRTNAQVALKVLKKERADDAAAVERFMREARAAALLGSEHITRVLDAEVSADGIPFIAMEKLDGVDLEKLDKENGPLHPERLVNIMVQACGALQAAHEKGIVHRDMKPANIFITKRRDGAGLERDFVKLLDFGISKMQATGERALTLAGTTMGTPAYMAYEQFFDARSVDGRADVYSVAAILYELLSRQRPYVANSYGELVMKVEKENPLPLKKVAPALPEALCAVVDKGLAKDRDERWQSAREFADALSRVGSLRGVVLRTEIANAALSPMFAETKEHVAVAPSAPSTTEPRPVSSRGDVRTVMMDPAAMMPLPNVVVEPQEPMEPTPQAARTGSSTVMMESVAPVAPTSSRATGNATVLMGQAQSASLVEEMKDASPKTDPVRPALSSRAASGNSTVLMGQVEAAGAVQDLEASSKPTDPAGRPSPALPGPRDEMSTDDAIKAAVKTGLIDKLGWKLVGALGAGALIVLAMLVWVIVLARSRH